MRDPGGPSSGRRSPHRGLVGNMVEGMVFASLLSGDRGWAGVAAQLLSNRILFVPLTYQHVERLANREVLSAFDFAGKKHFCTTRSMQHHIATQTAQSSLFAPAFLLGKFGKHEKPYFDYAHPYFIGSVITAQMCAFAGHYLPEGTVCPSLEGSDPSDQWPYVYLAQPLYEGPGTNFESQRMDCLRLPLGARVVSRKGFIHFVVSNSLRAFDNCGVAIGKRPHNSFVPSFYDAVTIEQACSVPDRVAQIFFRKLGVRLG